MKIKKSLFVNMKSIAKEFNIFELELAQKNFQKFQNLMDSFVNDLHFENTELSFKNNLNFYVQVCTPILNQSKFTIYTFDNKDQSKFSLKKDKIDSLSDDELQNQSRVLFLKIEGSIDLYFKNKELIRNNTVNDYWEFELGMPSDEMIVYKSFIDSNSLQDASVSDFFDHLKSYLDYVRTDFKDEDKNIHEYF
jgi:hypothetical protein